MENTKAVMSDGPASSAAPSSMLDKVSFIILTGLLTLLPIFVIPSALVSLLYGKMLLLVVGVLVTVSIGIFLAIHEGKFSLPSWRLTAVVAAVPLFTLIASFLSPHPLSSFMGEGFEFDTANFVFLGFLLMTMVTVFFQTKQRIFWAYVSILSVFVLIALFHVIRFIFGAGALDLGGGFPTIVSNTVGTWNDLGTYSGLAVLISFITLELIEVGRVLKIMFYSVLGLGLILLSVANFYIISGIWNISIPLTALVGVIALFIFVYVISFNYRSTKKIPVASLIVLVVCVIVTIAATPLATFVYGKLNISQADILDVRPTISGTFGVAKGMASSGILPALFGVGPNRFFAAWAMYKPVAVNQTVYWNTDFGYGAGYLLTTLITTGILGFLAWLFFLLTTFVTGVRSVFSGSKDKFSLYLLVTSLLASAYLWILSFFYVSSPVILIMAFFFTGLLGASLLREKKIAVKEFAWTSSQKKGFVAVLGFIVLFIAIVAWAFTWSQDFIASIDETKAIVILKQPTDLPASEGLAVAALSKEPSDDVYLRTYAQLKLLELQVDFQQSGQQVLSTSTQGVLAQAVNASEEAVRQNPKDYRNLIFLGSIYQTAGLLGVQGAGDAALSAYKQSSLLIPSSPLPAYLAGYLYALAKDPDQARAALQQALQIKPDFTEASTLISQLQAAPSTPLSNTSTDVQSSASPAATKTAATSTASTKTVPTKTASTTASKK